MLMSFRSSAVKKTLSVVMALFTFMLSSAPALGAWTYWVSRGDTLYSIARKVDVPVTAIHRANRLQTTRIQPGQRLVIPDNTPAATGSWSYRVQRGESLFTISRKVGVSWQQIAQANGIQGTHIRLGQALTIPGHGTGNAVTRTQAASVTRSTAATDANVELLARLIHAEARGESYNGQVAVGAVILNRVKSGRFPNSIPNVIYSPGQFCTVRDGQINQRPNATAYRAARAALNGSDPTNGALYFYNPAKTTSRWIWSRTVSLRIGSHVFAR